MEDRKEKDSLDTFQEEIGVHFNNKELLRQAFVHRSYINENRDSKMEHNERLEFLGDAVLELVITDYLYHMYPSKPEGELTSLRAALVNTTSLFNVAKSISINGKLYLSRGEAKDTGRAREYIMANAVEALIGAIYLDKGYDKAKYFIDRYISPRVNEIVSKKLWIDAKSFFQEKAQEIESETPMYEVLEEKGPDHDKIFVSGVYIKDELIAKGEGRSKQDAEQEAAKEALKKKDWAT
ncbi:MAG: ribonuclease III [Patescibacteria group bacterium]